MEERELRHWGHVDRHSKTLRCHTARSLRSTVAAGGPWTSRHGAGEITQILRFYGEIQGINVDESMFVSPIYN